MRNGFGRAVLATAVAALLAAAPAQSLASFTGAGEAPGYRFTPLSVYADFDGTGSEPFSSSTLPATPGAFVAIGDDNPDHTLYWDVEPSLMVLDGPQGGSVVTVELPNFVDQLPEKHMRVHLSWLGDLPPEIVEIIGVSDVDGTGAGSATHVGSSGIGPITPAGSYQYHDWLLEPNPDWESITIDVPEGTELMRVTLDTVSIPEPGTVGLLAAGAGLMLLRRRRAA